MSKLKRTIQLLDFIMQTQKKQSCPHSFSSLTPALKPFMVTQSTTKHVFNTAFKFSYYFNEVLPPTIP